MGRLDFPYGFQQNIIALAERIRFTIVVELVSKIQLPVSGISGSL